MPGQRAGRRWRTILGAVLAVLLVLAELLRGTPAPPRNPTTSASVAAKPHNDGIVAEGGSRVAIGEALIGFGLLVAAVFVFLWLSRTEDRQLPNVDVAIVTSPRSRDPAAVVDIYTLVIVRPDWTGCDHAEVRTLFYPDGEFPDGRTKADVHFAIGVTDDGREKPLQVSVGDTRQGLGETPLEIPALREEVPLDGPTDRQEEQQRAPLTPVTRVWARSVSGTMRDWSIDRPLRVDYEAAWTQRRSAGSCYAALPTYLGDGLDSAFYASQQLEQAGVAPEEANVFGVATATSGQTRLWVDQGELTQTPAVLPEDPAQPPLDEPPPQAPAFTDGAGIAVWRCDVAIPVRDEVDPTEPVRDCHSFLTVTRNGSDVTRGLALFLLGVLVSVAAQLLYDATRGYRRRLIGRAIRWARKAAS